MAAATPRAPLVAVGRKRFGPGWRSRRYPPHPGVEIFLVTRGGGWFLCGRERLAIRTGSLVLLGPGGDHAWRVDHPDGIAYHLLAFRSWDTERLRSLLGAAACRAVAFGRKNLAAYRGIYNQVVFEQDFPDSSSPERLRRLTKAVWALLERAGRPPGRAPERFSEPVRRARAFIRRRCHGIPRADEIARAARVRPRVLRALFRKEVGMGPKAYLLARKFEAAKDLLLSTDLPLKVVADRLGFWSVHPFAAFFRAREGLPPGAWRRRAGADRQ